MPLACPRCSYTRFWKLRRAKLKCKRCRREWPARRSPVAGIRADEAAWGGCVAAFLRDGSIRSVMQECGFGYRRAQKMELALRRLMTADVPASFRGPVELDETYIGGQRKNKRLHIRRVKSKRGHGTEKLPIFGLFDRPTGRVYVEVLQEKLDYAYIISTIRRMVRRGAPVFTDGYPPYQKLKSWGYRHASVDHNRREYVRGRIHTNNIEGFWGIMKRTMGTIGGMRRNRLYLFAGEIVWRFNHRKETRDEKERALLALVLRH